MTISIVGIYKHDFKDCPEELLKLSQGAAIWLQKEPDNKYDTMAVRAYSEGRFVGYVACDALPMLHQAMGAENGIECAFASLSEDEKKISASLDATISDEPLLPSNALDDWQPIGPVLSVTEEESDLRCRIGVMEGMAKKGEWNMGAEFTLSALLDDIHRILSGTDYCRLWNAVRTMRRCTGEWAPQWHEAADLISRELGRQGRPEQRQLRYEWVHGLAESDEMARILALPGEQLLRILNDMPESYKNFLFATPDVQIGRLYYAHLPDSTLRPLLTRLCINLYINEHAEVEEEAPADGLMHAPEGASAELGAEMKEAEATEEPHFRFFTSKADEQDRQDIEMMLRRLCVKRNGCPEVVRFLRRKIREGLVMDMFSEKEKLLDNLREFGLTATLKTFRNAASKNL